ncbi:hypothetical protein JCM1841_001790 [Sporobolomyces salmonicolor]
MSSPPPASREPDEQDQGSAAGGTGPWQAVFSPEANAWYFWNSETGQTTWENPLESSSTPTVPAPATDSATAAASAASTSEAAPAPAPADPTALPPIDPELAWLDPSAAARTSSTGAQLARFNARTGRFQVDPSMNPDRISDFQRSNRQQEAYFDVTGWQTQLQGQGIKRSAEGGDGEGGSATKKRPSSKQIEQFRKSKEEKKRKKLTSWLGS